MLLQAPGNDLNTAVVQVVTAIEFAVALAFILLMLRIAHILSANPIGELAEELLYLRAGDLRWPSVLVLATIFLEMAEFTYPWLSAWVTFIQRYALFTTYVNGLQAIFILVATVQVYLLIRRYTSKGLRDRISSTMETLAMGQVPRRRRRREEREEPEEE